MPYAVNIKKGTTINNADIGELPSGVAVLITERQALIAKHLIGVVVFDSVAGVTNDDVTRVYEDVILSNKALMDKDHSIVTYRDFVSYYKDVSTASEHWKVYKKSGKLPVEMMEDGK